MAPLQTTQKRQGTQKELARESVSSSLLSELNSLVGTAIEVGDTSPRRANQVEAQRSG